MQHPGECPNKRKIPIRAHFPAITKSNAGKYQYSIIIIIIIIIIIMTVPSALRCSATNVENNLPLMWKMKGMNRKMCRTVRQVRDLPLNIALKEDFIMILLFSFR